MWAHLSHFVLNNFLVSFPQGNCLHSEILAPHPSLTALVKNEKLLTITWQPCDMFLWFLNRVVDMYLSGSRLAVEHKVPGNSSLCLRKTYATSNRYEALATRVHHHSQAFTKHPIIPSGGLFWCLSYNYKSSIIGLLSVLGKVLNGLNTAFWPYYPLNVFSYCFWL